MKSGFIFSKSWVAAVFLVLGLVIGALAPSAKALAAGAEISWRLSGFVLQTTQAQGLDRFFIRCNSAIGAESFFLRPGGNQKVVLTDRDNNCLHLLASNLVLEIRNESRGSEGQRYFDVRVTRYHVVDSLRLSDLVGGIEEFHLIKAQKQQEGLFPIKYDEGFWTAKDRVYFGRVASADEMRVECRQYVQTVAGVVNPVGLRSLECRGLEEAPLRMRLLFVDTSLWLR